MKLEIDTEDPESLRKLEAQLLRSLSIVRAAINGGAPQSTTQDVGTPRIVPTRTPHTDQRVPQGVVTDIWTAIAPNLNSTFTTSEFLKLGYDAGRTKSELRKALNAFMLNSMIQEIEPSAGRRPATFKKVAE
jgi:hypothetical protein